MTSTRRHWSKRMLRILVIPVCLYALLVGFVYFRQRAMLYFPSHEIPQSILKPWLHGAEVMGYCREVPGARMVWLMMHGNAGQAADRDYVLERMSNGDSLYVLEYPGYGARPGAPSRQAFDQAAHDAYQWLRSQKPGAAIGVIGESIGCGPACTLAAEPEPPEKIVLLVPFDVLANVAAGKFPFLPVRLMMRDNWDNAAALRQYAGPVDIFAAQQDSIIPGKHARALAAAIPRARLFEIPGEHNEWSGAAQVTITR